MMALLVVLAGAWCVVVLVLLSVCRAAGRADRLPAPPIGRSKGGLIIPWLRVGAQGRRCADRRDGHLHSGVRRS
jgi:hypothetical protein